MPSSITLSLPYPLSVNRYWMPVGTNPQHTA